MGKRHFTLLYILLNIIIVVVLGVIDPHLRDIGQIFYQIKLPWVMGGILAMLLFWTMDGLILNYSISVIFNARSFIKCMKVVLVGQYYNAVTPFASGGQPAQVYYMKKFGVPEGTASSILMVKFLMYQVVLSAYCIIAFIFKGGIILERAPLVFVFSIIGFILNAGAVVLLLSMSMNKGLVKILVFKVLGFLCWIRLVKDLESAEKELISHVEDFHRGLHLFRGNLKGMIIMGIMTALQFACFLSITYFIYRSFGLEGAKWFDIFFVQAFLYLAVSFIPTPGSTGASETGFIVFFQFFFPKSIIFVSMLLWRLISYYMNIIVGGVVIVIDSIRHLATPMPPAQDS